MDQDTRIITNLVSLLEEDLDYAIVKEEVVVDLEKMRTVLVCMHFHFFTSTRRIIIGTCYSFERSK